MKKLLILSLVLAAFNSYGTYYPGTVVYQNGKSRTGLIESNLGRVIFFKAWMEAEPEEIVSEDLQTIWIKTNEGHKLHEYYYLPVEASDKKADPDHLWLAAIEKGAVSLYAHESISKLDGTDQSEALDFYCLRGGETTAKQIASHNNQHLFKTKASVFFADSRQVVEKIKSKEYNYHNVQELVRTYNRGL